MLKYLTCVKQWHVRFGWYLYFTHAVTGARATHTFQPSSNIPGGGITGQVQALLLLSIGQHTPGD